MHKGILFFVSEEKGLESYVEPPEIVGELHKSESFINLLDDTSKSGYMSKTLLELIAEFKTLRTAAMVEVKLFEQLNKTDKITFIKAQQTRDEKHLADIEKIEYI